jgi:hypothetical protein
MVNSGVRGTKKTKGKGKQQEPQDRGGLYEHRAYYLAYHNQVPSTGNLQYWYSRRRRRFGLVADASSGRCGHTRAVYNTGASIVRYDMQEQQGGAQERRREGGTRERGKGRRGRSGCWW